MTQGYSWDPEVARNSESPPRLEHLRATPAAALIYLTPSGQPYGLGDRLVQADYATTLSHIAEGGAEAFYAGQVGRAIGRDFAAHGGLFSPEEFANCAARWVAPTRGSYAGMSVLTHGPPGMGPLELRALHILEHLGIADEDPDSVRYYELLARVFQSIYRDRLAHNGDPSFVAVPLASLLSARGAAAAAARIRQGEPAAAVEPEGGSASTTHVSVIDREGTAVGLTHSNGDASGVVTPGLGFLYNNHMHMFDLRPDHPNGIQPGKRPRSGCSPLMVADGRGVRVVSGALGQYKVTGEIQALLGMLTFQRGPQAAIDAPRIHSDYFADSLYAEPSLPDPTVEQLQRRGWRCLELPSAAPLCMVLRDAGDALTAPVDHRGGGGRWPSP